MPKPRNYTTSIPAAQSIGEIEQILLDYGALDFMKKADPETRQFSEVMFTMIVRGRKVPFRFPVNIAALADTLYQEYRRSTRNGKKPREDFAEQAYRVGWRIIKDWLHAQVSLLDTGMVQLETVMMPYILMDMHTGKLLSDHIYEDGMKMLPAKEG